MAITFDINPNPEATLDLQPLHVRYGNCVEEVRSICGTASFKGMRATSSHERQSRYFNLILKFEDIKITCKVDKTNLYMFGYRKGEGEPEPNNQQNNQPWWCVQGYDASIPGARETNFPATYDAKSIEGREVIGPVSLVQAVRNLYYDHSDKKRAFFTIVILILEAARFRVIEDQISNNMKSDPWSDTKFRDIHKAMIKNWQDISNVVMKHGFDPNQADHKLFGNIHSKLKDLTVAQAQQAIGILKSNN